MMTRLLLLLMISCLLLPACQGNRRDTEKAAAVLNQLDRLAADEIVQEKNGAPPPTGFANWPAFWRNRFLALQLTPGNLHQGSRDPHHLAILNLAFIKQKRAAAGLPPVD